MSPLTLKRIFVWIVSMILGFIISWAIITVGFPLIKAEAAGLTIADYGNVYFITTAIPIGFIFVIWLDYFLDTKILVD